MHCNVNHIAAGLLTHPVAVVVMCRVHACQPYHQPGSSYLLVTKVAESLKWLLGLPKVAVPTAR